MLSGGVDMRYPLETYIRWVIKLISYAIGFMLLVQVIVIVSQVLLRNFANYPITWSEELSRYLMIWITFLGGAWAVAADENIVIDIVVTALPPRWQSWALFVADLATVILLVLLITWSLSMFSHPVIWYQVSPAMQLPMIYLYASLPLGCFLMLVFQILRSFIRMRGGSRSLTESSGSTVW
jgi:TRAP-type C4-dicarboxylate transport system permease small subunit